VRASVSESTPRWPAWYGLAALGLSLVIAVFAGAILVTIIKAAGATVTDNSPGLNIGATLIQDGVLVGCAVWLAAHTAPPHAWQFGLRGTSLWRGIKWAGAALLLYFVFQLIYVAVVNPHEKQTTLQDLGAGTGGLATLAIGILVVGVAPFAEEFFFRGFFYGALRTSFAWFPAALIDGVVFGLVHAPTGIEAVPPLIALGFAFCMCYEATGSIYPTIALHALNNMLAFGVDKDGSWAVGGVVAGAVVAGCILLPRAMTRPPQRATTG
jgi:membrane protease YdiL (CAAX protease family)